jgi:hypothetical protein
MMHIEQENFRLFKKAVIFIRPSPTRRDASFPQAGRSDRTGEQSWRIFSTA